MEQCCVCVCVCVFKMREILFEYYFPVLVCLKIALFNMNLGV